MLSFLLDFPKELWNITIAMAPYLLLGFLFAGMLKVWFPQSWIDRFLGQNNFSSVVNAAIIGVPLPLCSCGVIPTGISLYRNGASKGSTVSFFISTPQTGVDSILVTYSMLGLPFAILRVFIAFVTGIVGGWITNLIEPQKQPIDYRPDFQNKTKQNKTLLKSLIKVFSYGFYEFLMDIAKWLIIGLILAALLATVIPDNFFSLYLDNELLSMLIVLIAAVPLYLCATASVPVAAVLMLKGMSPGAALVLLMAGPATNAATITMIRKVFGNRTLASYLGSIIGGALIFGYMINNFLPREWFGFSEHVMHHNHEEMIPVWLGYLSAFTLFALILNGYIQQWIKSRRKKPEPALSTQSALFKPIQNQPVDFSAPVFIAPSSIKPLNAEIYIVEGMTCSHCKSNVENGLKKIPGIKFVNANPQTNTVSINGETIDPNQIKTIVEELGYSFKGLKNSDTNV